MAEAQLLLFDLDAPPQRLQDASLRSRHGRRTDQKPAESARINALAPKTGAGRPEAGAGDGPPEWQRRLALEAAEVAAQHDADRADLAAAYRRAAAAHSACAARLEALGLVDDAAPPQAKRPREVKSKLAREEAAKSIRNEKEVL